MRTIPIKKAERFTFRFYFSLGYVTPEKKSSRDMSYNLQNLAIEANVGDLAFRS